MLSQKEVPIIQSIDARTPENDRLMTLAVLSNLADLPYLESDLATLRIAACDRLGSYGDNANNIGLDVAGYVDTVVAASVGDVATLNQLVEVSERRMQRDDVLTSVEYMGKEELYEKHIGIVKSLLKGVKKSRHQKLTIIAGPYAAGKTEIFEDRFNNQNDQVVIDLDQIRELLMTGYDPTSQIDIQRVRAESWMVSDLLLKTALKHKYSCLIQTSLHRKSRWLEDPAIRYAKKNNIPIEVQMLLRPVTDCLDRNMNRPRSATIRDLMESMKGMATLVDFVKRFGRGVTVHLIDFYPLIEKEQKVLPVLFRDQYRALLDYARKRKDIFASYYVKEHDLPVI